MFVLFCFGCEKESQAIVSIALHPTNANILYVATNDAVYKSRDGGQLWERFPSFSARRVTTLAIDPQFPATIYAGTMADAVYKSPDGGQHWLPHNVGLKEHVSFINQFVFHPTDHEQIYAATTVGAFYTKDGGREWEERMAGMKEVHIVVSIAIHPRDPRVLYAGTTGGIYRSDSAAMGWKKINNGLIPEQELMGGMALGVNAIVFDVVNPDIVYAGTTKGLFRTDDARRTVGANRAIAPRSVREQYPPRPGPAEDPLYRRAGGSLEKPRQRTDLDRDQYRTGLVEYSHPRDEPARFTPTLCRHEWERSLPLDRRRRDLDAPTAQGRTGSSSIAALGEAPPCWYRLL